MEQVETKRGPRRRASPKPVAAPLVRRRSGGSAGADRVTLVERTALLAKVALFRDLTPDELRPIAAAATVVDFARGESIVRQGDSGDSMYIVVSGEVEVRVTAESGEGEGEGEAVVAKLMVGDVVGEFSVLDEQPRSATCVATVRTRCLRLNRDEFVMALRRYWALTLSLLRVLTRRLRVADALLAEHARDPLTGLDNRAALAKVYEREISRLKRSTEQGNGSDVRPLALLLADVDRLKQVNDHHGHVVGDEVLRAAAEALTSASRAMDVVVRYGGDEFVVLMPEAGQEGAELVAERTRRALQERQTASVPFSMSIGTALVDPHYPAPLEHVLAEADLHMYRDKARSRRD